MRENDKNVTRVLLANTPGYTRYQQRAFDVAKDRKTQEK